MTGKMLKVMYLLEVLQNDANTTSEQKARI
jgi:hypothetical protein